MDTFFRELRFALRLLLKTPGSTAVAVVTMTLGIGLSAATFSILDGAVLRGLPFPDSDRLLHLERNQLARGISSMEVTHHDFEDWRAQQTSFEDLAGFTAGTVNLSDSGLPERYNGVWITPNFLELLRADPLMGRGLRPEDALPGAEPVILLGHHVWQKRYGGDPGVVGRVVRANSRPTTIVGVMGEGFRFPVSDDVWMPLVLDTQAQRGEGETLEVFGRLRDGVTLDEAGSEFTTIAARLSEQYPETNEGVGVVIHSYISEFLGDEAIRLLSVMMGAVLLVLLIACFNVTNLLLGRASTRIRELAIRSALGSGRARTVAQVLVEGLLISAAGAALGVGLAHFGVKAFNAAIATTDPPFWINIFISGRVLLFVAAATVASALIAGLVPAIRASRPDLNHVLQDSTRGSTSFRLGWLSRALVVVQVALSCALMVGAALMVRSVLAAYSFDLRFEPANVLTARVGLFEGDYPEEQDWIAFYDELERRVAGEAQVASMAFGTTVPTDTEVGAGGSFFERPGETYDSPRDMPWARLTRVTPGYFETFGLTVLTGRDFTSADRLGAPAVALVNEDFARKEWPGESPIGKRVNLWRGEELEAADPNAGWVEVVGLVPDLRFAEFDNEDDQQGVYLPLAQSPVRFTWIVVKTRTEPLQFSEPLRRAVLAVDPDLPLYFVRSMDQVLERTMFYPNLFGVLFSVFGVVALVLASVGMYGVMAFGVTRRTQEMGVRMAFGARVRDVVGLILKQGMRQVTLGLAIGLVLAVGMGMALAIFLYQVRPYDPVTFTLVPALLAAVSLAACLVPARRASAVDPIVALRYE
jgi:predicted permease